MSGELEVDYTLHFK